MAQTITIKINGNGKKPRARKPRAKRRPTQNFGPIWRGTAFGGRRQRLGRFSTRAAIKDIRVARREVVSVGKGVVGAGRTVVKGGRVAAGVARAISRRFVKPKASPGYSLDPKTGLLTRIKAPSAVNAKAFPKVSSKEFRAGQKALPKIQNRGPKPVKKPVVNQNRDLNRKKRLVQAFDRAAAGKL